MIKASLISFLEAIDFFAITPACLFTYKMKLSYSTLYTKTMTILVIMISILGFLYFSRSFLSKSNPQTVLSEEYTQNPSQVLMNKEFFLLNFALQNKTNDFIPFIDESVYKPEVFLNKRQNEVIFPMKVSIGPCVKEDLPSIDEDLKNYFLDRHYSSMYCFKDYSQILLNGTWDSEIYKELLITVRPCENSTDEITCKPKEFIEKAIEGSFVVIQHTSLVLDLNSYEKPLKVFAVNNFQPISLIMATSMYLQFCETVVETDTGYINKDARNDGGMNLISQKFNLFVNKENNDFIRIYVRLDRIKKKFSRSYDKLQDVLAEVGGLMRFFTFLGSLLLQPFLKEALLQRVSNDIFDFGDYFEGNRGDFGKMEKNLNTLQTIPKIKLGY